MMSNYDLQTNINKIYWIKFFAMFIVLMPVIVPFFNSIGLDMHGVYLLQSVFAITMFITEIPSGYLSDMIGRKKTLLLGHFLKGVGFSLFPLATNLEVLIIAEIILGIAVSLNSGTDTALIYDTLEELGSPKAQIKVLGRSLSFLTLGEGLAALFGSLFLLASISLDKLAWISAIMSWAPFCISLFLVEPKRAKMQDKHLKNFQYIYEKLFQQSRLLNLVIINMIFYFSATLTAVWLFQTYWEQLHIPLVYFGFLWALSNFTVALVGRHAHKIEKKLGSTAVMIIVGLLPILGYQGISWTTHWIGVGFCLLFQVCRALGTVVMRDALNKRVTADFRATANSVAQMGVRIFFALLGPLVGYFIDHQGLVITTQYLVYFYILVFMFVLLPLMKLRSEFIKI
jgi:MFS family permease